MSNIEKNYNLSLDEMYVLFLSKKELINYPMKSAKESRYIYISDDLGIIIDAHKKALIGDSIIRMRLMNDCKEMFSIEEDAYISSYQPKLSKKDRIFNEVLLLDLILSNAINKEVLSVKRKAELNEFDLEVLKQHTLNEISIMEEKRMSLNLKMSVVE